MHRKVSMGTSSNTKALLQTLLWRQQGDIGGRLGKLVIYIHNVMRPIQIFASHIVTLMWGFLEQKKADFSPQMSHFGIESIFYFDKTFDEKWKFKASFPNWWWAIEFEKHLKSSEYSFFSSALLFSVPPEILQFSGRETPFSSNLCHHPSLLSLLPQWVGRNKKINSRFLSDPGPIIVYPSQWLTH